MSNKRWRNNTRYNDQRKKGRSGWQWDRSQEKQWDMAEIRRILKEQSW